MYQDPIDILCYINYYFYVKYVYSISYESKEQKEQ